MSRVRPLIALTAALMLLASLLTGCTKEEIRLFCSRPPSRAATEQVTRHAVIVVGNVANSPRWAFTAQQSAELTEILAAGGRIDLVSTAGDGYLCPAERFRLKELTPDMNPAGKEATIRDNLRRIRDEMTTAPRDNGQDVYAALHLAAGQLASVLAEHRSLYLLANGANDRGRLDHTPEGALGADVEETMRYLRSPGPLPLFPDVHVVATGFGYTAAPQPTLDQTTRQWLADTYHAILTASAHDAVIDPAPATGEAIDTLGKTVTPVQAKQPARPPVCRSEEVVFDQTSALKFHGRSTAFLDRDAAIAALTTVTDWLRADQDRTVAILGTTARVDSRENQEATGRGRANVVRDLLVSAGVEPGRVISVDSHGSYFPQYVNDQAPDGGLIPSAAARNRSVRLTLTDPC